MTLAASDHPNGCGCAVCKRRRERLASEPRERELAAAHDDSYAHSPGPDAQVSESPGEVEAAGSEPTTTVVHHHHHEREPAKAPAREGAHRAGRRAERSAAGRGDRTYARRHHRHHRHGGILRTLLVGAVLVWLLHSFYPGLDVPGVPGVACGTSSSATTTVDTAAVDPATGQPVGWLGSLAQDTIGAALKHLAVTVAGAALSAVGDTVRSMVAAPPSLPDIRGGLVGDAHEAGAVVGFVAGGLSGADVTTSADTGPSMVAPVAACGACPGTVVPAVASGAVDGIDVAARAALRAGWTPAQAVVAVAIAGAESTWRHDARNPSGASGMWQTMMPMHAALYHGGSWLDPYANARVSHALWAADGWQPWTTWTSGAFRPFLARAAAAVAAASTPAPPAVRVAPAVELTSASSGARFHVINAPITGGLHDQWTGFPAVDVAVPTGTPVLAGAAGRVTVSRDVQGSYGRYIEVASGGFSTLYAHLSERDVTVGQSVRGGQRIGLSGSTGNSTGPHLHFGAQGISPYAFFGKGSLTATAAAC